MPATDSPQYPPNPKLRAARQQRNWTLNDAARELRTLMVSRGEAQVGVNLHHVSRWERGERRPGMRHRHYLCMLYGLRADQLGFVAEDDRSGYVEPPLDSQTGQAPQSKANGHAPQPGCADGDLDKLNLTRRKLLAASGLLGAALGVETATDAAAKLAEPLDHAASVASGHSGADDALIDDLNAIAEGFGRTSMRVRGDLLIRPLHAHLDLVKSVLQQPLLPRQREALLCNASQVTSLLSMLLFFGLGDRVTARRLLIESISMGEETSDTATHARGLVQAARQCIYTGEGDKSLKFLAQARTLAERTLSPNTLSWILANQAEALATLHQPKDIPRLLDLATQAHQRSRPEQEPYWIRYWNRERIAGYAGGIYMRLERPGPARVALNEALAAVQPPFVKHRPLYMVDLAITRAQEREAEAACELAGKALDFTALHDGAIRERMAILRRRLAPLPKVRAVKDLDDRLRALKPV